MRARQTLPASVQSNFAVQRIMHAALMLSVLIYGMILWVAPRQGDEVPLDVTMVIVFGAAAAGSIAALFVMRNRMMPPRRTVGIVQPEITQAGREALAKLNTANVLSWALAESVAVFGLLLGFMQAEPLFFLPFAAVSYALFILTRPTPTQGGEAVAAAQG